jgi:hypothetical protein
MAAFDSRKNPRILELLKTLTRIHWAPCLPSVTTNQFPTG